MGMGMVNGDMVNENENADWVNVCVFFLNIQVIYLIKPLMRSEHKALSS